MSEFIFILIYRYQMDILLLHFNRYFFCTYKVLESDFCEQSPINLQLLLNFRFSTLQICSNILMMELPKTTQELTLLIQSHLSSPANDLTRGGLLAHFRASKNNTEFYQNLKGFYGERWSDSFNAPVRSAVQRIIDRVDKQINNIGRQDISKKIVSYLNEKYELPKSCKRPVSEIEVCDLPAPETPPATPPVTPAEPPTHSSFDYVTPKRSCMDCRDLRQESSSLRKELNYSRSEAERLQKKVDVKFKKEPRVLGQANKRLKTQLEKQQETNEQKFFELQFEFLELQEDFIELDAKYNEKVNRIEQLVEDVDHLNNQVAKLAKQKTEIRRYHNAVKKQSVLSSQLKSAKEEIKALKSQLAYTENLLPEHDKENTINTIDGKQFDARTRKCILFCLEKNVSQQNASSIVQFIVQEMTGKRVPKVPKRSTVQNIAREGSILANIQTGQIMSESSNVTLAWDATTKKGLHVNEIHVITPFGSFVLDVSELPGGRAPDYATHVKEILADIADQYSACHNKNPDDVKKQIHDGKVISIFDHIACNNIRCVYWGIYGQVIGVGTDTQCIKSWGIIRKLCAKAVIFTWEKTSILSLITCFVVLHPGKKCIISDI